MKEKIYDKWTTQLRKGMLELAILHAINSARLYGYSITKRLGAIDGLVVTEGTIYPILNRLKREGLIGTSLEESSEGPVRKYFNLTPLGVEHLERMNRYWSVISHLVSDLSGGTGDDSVG
jgi:PadR family transcriptional regulator PadR